MKTQTAIPLQPKWLCAAAIGALTFGGIVGANAQNTDGDLPAPPSVSGQMARPGGQGGGPQAGPPGMGLQEQGQDDGGWGPPPRGGQGMNGGRPGGPGPMGPDDGDEMGPPMGMDDMDEGGPDGFGPPGGGPGMGGPGAGQGMGGPGRGGPGGGQNMGGPGMGGPGQGGQRPGGPRGEDSNTAAGAAQALEFAYNTAGQAEAAGKLKGDAVALQTQAHDYYDKALDAYQAKNYDKASTLADVSSHLSHAALALTATEGPKGATGWAAPPTLAAAPKNMDQNRAAMSLNRTYRELSRPARATDKTNPQWLQTAKTFYKTASTSYTAKNYNTAQSYATAADEVIQASRGASEAANL